MPEEGAMTDTAGWAELLRGGRLPLLALIWFGVTFLNAVCSSAMMR